VFRAVDPDGDRIVAIKLFRLDWPPEQARALAGALETLIETLPSHPNIVMPLASGLEGGCAWLAQEFVGADSLEARLRRRTPVHASEAVALMRQVAAGLDLAAAAGWRHGALHPRDILVDTSGGVHVTGVGVAQVVERFGARPHRRRPYTAPERAIAAGWDARADVFALATIASEMLGPRRSRGQSDEARIAAFSEAGFNGRLAADVLNRGMSNVAGERPTTAAALIDALEQTIGVPDLDEDARLAGPGDATGPATLFDIPVDAAVDGGSAGATGPTDAPAPEVPGATEAVVTTEEGLRSPGVVEPDEAAALAEPSDAERFAASTVIDLEPIADAAGSQTVFDDWQLQGPSPPVDVLEAADTRREPDERGEPDQLEWTEARPPVVPATAAIAADRITSFPDEAGARDRPLPWGWLAAVLIVGVAAGFALGRWSVIGTVGPPPAAASSPPSTAPAAVVDEPVLGEGDARGTPPVPGAARTAPSGATSAPPAPAASPAPTTVPAAAVPAPARPGAPAAGAPGAPDRTSAGRPGVASTTATPTPGSPAASPPAPAKPAPAGRLLVRTTPAGARVRIDGKDRGASPLTLRGLGLQEFAVEIVRSGYATETRRVRLTSRRPSQTIDVRLRPVRRAEPGAAAGGAATPGPTAAPGGAASAPAGRASLELVTRPAGARVLVDGQFIGVTPLRMVDVAPGQKNVSFELAGYARWSAVVTVAPGEPRKVAASLEPLP
jgi:hypothetical protein